MLSIAAPFNKLAAIPEGQVTIRDVAGHEHVAAGRKADPGPGFDWERLRARLGWSVASFPPSP